jgi:glycerol uptake facilitator-like aquaporin
MFNLGKTIYIFYKCFFFSVCLLTSKSHLDLSICVLGVSLLFISTTNGLNPLTYIQNYIEGEPLKNILFFIFFQISGALFGLLFGWILQGNTDWKYHEARAGDLEKYKKNWWRKFIGEIIGSFMFFYIYANLSELENITGINKFYIHIIALFSSLTITPYLNGQLNPLTFIVYVNSLKESWFAFMNIIGQCIGFFLSLGLCYLFKTGHFTE